MITYCKKFIITYFILLSIFLVSLFLSCAIPSSRLRSNIGKSLVTLKKEGTYPSFGLPWRKIILDNYTDPLMMNTAYSVDSSHLLKSALAGLRFEDSNDSVNQISNLEKLYTRQVVPKTGYERYWHGYLIFLRPLLVFFSYSGIRNIVTFMLYGALIIFSIFSWKRLGKAKTLFIIIGLFAVDFFYLGRSMQFTGVFLIGLFSSIYLLMNNKRNPETYVPFFIAGGLTAFFDLLTAPLVTLGILLIVSSILDNKDIKKIIINSLSWLGGYFIFWSSKWVLAELFVTPNAITTSLNQIVNRTVNKADVNFSQLKAVSLNFFQIVGYDKQNKIIILILGIFTLFIWLRYFTFKKEKLKNAVLWLMIGIIPYAWYLIVANQSYLHCWYTYRNQLMSVVSLFFIMGEFFDRRHLYRDLQSLRSKTILLFPSAKKHS